MATTKQPQSTRPTMKVTAVGDAADVADEDVSALLALKQKVIQVEVVVSSQTHNVELRDTGDMAELDRLQPAVYRATNCFLLCYAERDRATFEVIETKWFPEVSSICPGVPFLLVACRRPGDPAAARQVSAADGQKLCTKIKAAGFVEFEGEKDVEELLKEALAAVASHAQVRPEAVKTTPGHVEEVGGGGGGGVGCCSCFKRCFKSKDSSYSFE